MSTSIGRLLRRPGTSPKAALAWFEVAADVATALF
jgi:hypothetical protein